MAAVNKPARDYTPVNFHSCQRGLNPRNTVKYWFLIILIAAVTNAQPYNKKTQNISNGTSDFENVSQKLDELVFDNNVFVPHNYHLLPKTSHKYGGINAKTTHFTYDPEKYSVSSAKIQNSGIPYAFNEELEKSPTNSYDGPSSHSFSRLTRIRRQAECTLSEEKLLEFKKTINEALSQASTELNKCESNDTSSNCDKWVIIMQCGVKNLKDGLAKTKSTTNSYNEIRNWNEAYKTIKFKYDQSEDIIRETVSQSLIEQLDSIRDDLVDFSTTINNIERDIKERQIKLIIEEIKHGNIEKALEHFEQVGRASALIDIVQGVYGDNVDLNNLKNLISFANSVRTCSQYEIIYITLYDIIKSKNRLNGSEVILLHNNNRECLKDSQIRKLLGDKVLEIVDSWAMGIRNSDYKHVIEHMAVDYNSVSKRYPELIRKAYNNTVGNVKNILKFIRDMPDIKDQCVLLPLLYNSMKDNNDLDSSELLMLVYRVKEMSKMTNVSVSDEYTKPLVELVKGIPIPVLLLVWRGYNCTIMSKNKKEYIYSPIDSFAQDEDRRQVFTWVPGDKVFRGFWLISPEMEGEHFAIKNEYFQEYLYADSGNYDTSLRRVFTWRPGTSWLEADWQLEPTDNGQYFAIKSKVFQEYLFTPEDNLLWNTDRRHVFVLKGKSNITESMKWKIQC